MKYVIVMVVGLLLIKAFIEEDQMLWGIFWIIVTLGWRIQDHLDEKKRKGK